MEGPERDSEVTDDAREPRFLPPEPAGPEPDLADRPPQQTYGYPPAEPGQGGGYAPPAGAQQASGYARQAPPGYGGQQTAPPGYGGYQAPPPGYGGYQAPPPGWGQPPQWAWQPPVPDNGPAVAGFVFSIVGAGLVVISFGLSTIVSLGCSIAGVILSRNGKRKVARGETPKHGGLAQAGYIVGWVGVGLSILATVTWVLLIAFGAVDDSSGGSPANLRSAVALAVGS